MKTFNTTGICNPQKHYMVDLSQRLAQIKIMVDAGKYFAINRARQYGKTTTLAALRKYLMQDYEVISMDFQAIGSSGFASEKSFIQDFCRLLIKETLLGLPVPDAVEDKIESGAQDPENLTSLGQLFDILTEWCAFSEKPIVLLIDEVDSATNNQVFLDFLAQLRLQYLEREARDIPAFQSVILAGVTDVRNLKRKLRPEEAHKINSSWNIAADFNIDMSLSETGIRGMLDEYEADHHTGMDTGLIAKEIRSYTSGYPFLVSRICQLMDERLVGSSDRFSSLSEVWTLAGVSEAVRMILSDTNLLFDSLMGKVQGNDTLREILRRILFSGESLSFNPYDLGIGDAFMYGLVTNENGKVRIANRIFETLLYNYFLSQEETKSSAVYRAGDDEKHSFIQAGRLQMETLLERYITVFNDLYGDREEHFSEAEGRRRFLLFIRPVINGTGNYYIEAQTRDSRRMDLVIDYLGERFVVELKIWNGQAYHEEGEKQLAGYLDACHLDRGYLLTYSFRQSRQTGITQTVIGGKTLIEAFV